MSTRPYLNFGIADLEQLFANCKHDRLILSRLNKELDVRRTDRAQALKLKVIRAIASNMQSDVDAGNRSKRSATTKKTGPKDSAHRNKATLTEPTQDSDGSIERETPLSDPAQPHASNLDADERARFEGLYAGLREKLLDLTKRNRMLSYSFGARSKKHLQIVDEVPEDIYQALVVGNGSLDLKPIPEPADIPDDEKTEEFLAALNHAKVSEIEYLTELAALENSSRDDDHSLLAAERNLRKRLRERLGMSPRPERAAINRSEHARSHNLDLSPELPRKANKPSHKDRQLQTAKYPDELEATLEKINDDARLAEQEMGVSTLFMAFGFLEWYDSDASDKKYFAPLLLMPVKLISKTHLGHTTFSLSASGGFAEANLSLQKFLEKTFNRKLPDYLAEEEDEGSIEAYLQQVAPVIAGLNRWTVRRWVVLGHFAFGRLAMYADLAPENWRDHPVEQNLVQSVLAGTQLGEESVLPSIPPDYDIDSPEIETIAPRLIHDADASQHSALIDVVKGSNLVIEGPPGTGKSQTITNIIANALSNGKSVLFLAEKQAALEVVKRRLDASGLGDFCLELHSDKSSTKQVVEKLKQRMSLGTGRRQPAHTLADPTWIEARKTIADYLDVLHAADKDDRRLFDNIWESVRWRDAYPSLFDSIKQLELPIELRNNPDQIPLVLGLLEIYSSASQFFLDAHGHAGSSPWRVINVSKLSAYDTEPFAASLKSLHSNLKELLAFLAACELVTDSDFESLREAARYASTLPVPPSTGAVATLLTIEPSEAARLLELLETLNGLSSQLAALPSVGDIDIESLSLAPALLASVNATPVKADQTPKAIYEKLERELAQYEAAVTAVGPLASSPIAKAMAKELEGAGLDALSTSIICVSNVSIDQRRWLNLDDRIDPRLFDDQYAEWKELLDAERDWRSRSQYTGQNWPASEKVKFAAGVLAKGAIASIGARLNGSRAKALELVNSLGGWQDRPPTSAELASLANHLRTLEGFLHENPTARTLGDQWSGLDTPFDNIAAGMKVGQFLKTTISESAQGAVIFDYLKSLNESSPGELSHYDQAAKQFRKLPQDTRKFLADLGPLKNVLETLKRRVTAHGQALSIDPDRALTQVNLPLNAIVSIADLRLSHRDISEELWAAKASASLADLTQDGRDLSPARSAINWIRHIRAARFSEESSARLLSTSLSEYRERACLEGEKLMQHLDAIDAAVNLFTTYAIELPELRSPYEQVAFLQPLLDAEDQLFSYLSLMSDRDTLNSHGLGEFLDVTDKISLAPSLLPTAFRLLQAYKRALHTCQRKPSLGKINGAALEARRRIFAERDRAKIEKDRDAIRNGLLPGRPPRGNNIGPKKTWTEMVLIENEVRKQQRFIPLRTLVTRSHRSLQALMPCFMMSPLSLAKFLPAGAVRFDLVVIDEASQMRPEDALGGLLRAEQIVVVGDPKQLPPTDFFSRASSVSSSDDDELDELDDESILEACQKAFRRARRLKWHYRSRCESLIAFSNSRFYENSLVTFPMSRPGSFSVDYVHLNGHYQAQQNVTEALRLAEDAIGFMRHHAESGAKSYPSLGIVAVNTEQRDLIREELHRLSAGDELVEHYQQRVAEAGEPVFIKNLENVQGDERDFILISLTYAREPGSAVVKQRFGPINGRHGHRRLNVLFSRARQRIVLYTSLAADDIKPTATSHRGVHILKDYLEYAASKGRVHDGGTGADVDSDFEAAVADRLRTKGYLVDYQVGVSGYRIDLGIRHESRPGDFIVGIECDGATYHSSKSARDRDRLREEVLRGLGWTLLRVWSTDWFYNPEEETRKLIAKIEAIRNASVGLKKDHYTFNAGGFSSSLSSQSPGTDLDDLTSSAEDELAVEVIASETSVPCATATSLSDVVDGGSLSARQAMQLLRELRDSEIALSVPDWELERSIVREGMIETLISKRIIDQDQWFLHVPQYQRQNTNKLEKDRYFDRICDIIARIN